MVIATLAHSLPDSIASGFIRQSMSCGQLGNLLGSDLSFPTAARFTRIAGELIFPDEPSVATVTTAFKESPVFSGEHMPAIEPKSDNVLHTVEIMNKVLVEVNWSVYHGE